MYDNKIVVVVDNSIKIFTPVTIKFEKVYQVLPTSIVNNTYSISNLIGFTL